MSRKPAAPGLRSRPRVEELRHAGSGEKIAVVCGLAVASVAALILLLWGRQAGALAGLEGQGSAPNVPTVGFAGGLVAVVVGALLLFFGWPLYRLTVILVGLLIGGAAAGGLGWVAGGQTGALVGGLLGGALGAIAAWPAEVLVRSLGGALAGMTLGTLAGSWTGSPVALILCALGGLLLGGGLTFLFYKALIMSYSALAGAMIVGYGGISVWRPLSVVELRPLMLGAVAGLAVLGLFVQRSLGAGGEPQAE
jgi:hypothetical protein